MEAITKQRKNIDLSIDTMNTLSLFAVKEGVSLKKYIETKLDELSQDLMESQDYTFLLQTQPEGRIIISEEDKQDFENFLGV